MQLKQFCSAFTTLAFQLVDMSFGHEHHEVVCVSNSQLAHCSVLWITRFSARDASKFRPIEEVMPFAVSMTSLCKRIMISSLATILLDVCQADSVLNPFSRKSKMSNI